MSRTKRRHGRHTSRSIGFENLEDRRVLAALVPGNLLISTEPTSQPQVREYQASGALVQQFNLPPGATVGEKIRDVIVDRDGNVQIYHGTFGPTQDELDPVTGSLSQITVSGWSTVNNVSYGGVATLQDYVFVTDMATAGDGSPRGIIRIDTNGLSAVRFSETVDFTDLTLGLDGQLYGLTSTRKVYAFDPITLADRGNITLSFADHRGIAVNRAGEIFSAAWDGSIYHYDAQGNSLNALATGVNNLTDIDLREDGALVVGSYSGTVALTDETLSLISSSFSTGSSAAFVAFTDGPPNHAPRADDAAFAVAENSANGTLVGQVSGTDVDGDSISFAITAGNESGTFAIDDQGNLTVADQTSLDYELQASYTLSVRVTDAGQLFDEAIVSIDVQDVNDVPPVLTAAELTIGEGQTVVIDSGNLAATDVDSADGALTFLVSNVVRGEFQVDGAAATAFTQDQVAAGLVTFVHDDSESAPSFDVQVTDGELASALQAGTISFANVNDNPPVIPPGQSYWVGEDATGGTVLGSVSFSDADLPGDSLAVSIVGGDPDGVFAIDAVGVLSVLDDSQLDFESVASYNLVVTVFDGIHTTSESVLINVTNVNDVAPVLTANALAILEGESLLISAANFSATDVDSDDPSLIFNVSSISGGEFQIAGVPGTSFSQGQIAGGDVYFVHDDSELSPAFDISVSDGAFSTAPAPATVLFTNVNDQAPQVPPGQEFSVSEAAGNGTSLGTVAFGDADLPGDTLVVEIVSGNPDNTFGINAAGNLTVLDDSGLDYETTDTYLLGVQVSDGLFATVETVVINVLDVQETKFFVPDSSADATFQYAADGSPGGSTSLGGGNDDARGATAHSTGSTLWVVDEDQNVYVYDESGNLQGSWHSTDVSRPEGIATDDTDLWIVDGQSDSVYRYSGAAGFLSGSHAANSTFKLDNANKNPTGITTDGTHIWVVNDKMNADTVFKYTVAGSLVGSWNLDNANTRPEGITIDPTNVNDVWIVDDGTDQVFQYAGGAGWNSGSHAAAATFDLSAGNSSPRGIADPPPPEQGESRPTSASFSGHFATAVDRIWDQAASPAKRPARADAQVARRRSEVLEQPLQFVSQPVRGATHADPFQVDHRDEIFESAAWELTVELEPNRSFGL